MLRGIGAQKSYTESKMQKGQWFLPSRGVPPSWSQKMLQINNSIRKLLYKKNGCCVLFFLGLPRFSYIYFFKNKISKCIDKPNVLHRNQCVGHLALFHQALCMPLGRQSRAGYGAQVYVKHLTCQHQCSCLMLLALLLNEKTHALRRSQGVGQLVLLNLQYPLW